MVKIISLSKAVEQRETPASIEQLADWHAERSDREFDRHDMIAFRLRKLAAALR